MQCPSPQTTEQRSPGLGRVPRVTLPWLIWAPELGSHRRRPRTGAYAHVLIPLFPGVSPERVPVPIPRALPRTALPRVDKEPPGAPGSSREGKGSGRPLLPTSLSHSAEMARLSDLEGGAASLNRVGPEIGPMHQSEGERESGEDNLLILTNPPAFLAGRGWSSRPRPRRSAALPTPYPGA